MMRELLNQEPELPQCADDSSPSCEEPRETENICTHGNSLGSLAMATQFNPTLLTEADVVRGAAMAAGGARKHVTLTGDPWTHRSKGMKCKTCMWWVRKATHTIHPPPGNVVGRCRRHAPTMSGYPVVFIDDWCGDHKLNEEAT